MSRWGVSALVVFALLVVPVAALAGPFVPPEFDYQEPALPEFPSCPADPEATPKHPQVIEPEEGVEPPTAEELQLDEMRRQRAEAVEVCRVISQRLDEVIRRQWWTTAQLVDNGVNALHMMDKLQQLQEAVERQCAAAPCGITIEGQTSPVEVEGTEDGEVLPVEEGATAEIVSAVDASGEASKAGLWFLAGLICICLLAYPVYKLYIFWKSD